MKKTLLTISIIAATSANFAFADTGDICTNCPDLTPTKNISDYVDMTYYANSHAQRGTDIATFRNAIISDISVDQIQLSYSEVWTALTYTDEDPNNKNNVILIYKGNSIPETENAGIANNSNYWNREHVWAKSHGFKNKSQRAYTDIHHLRPADSSVNSSRGNKDFGKGDTEHSEAIGNSSSTYTWEPRDEVKGDIARMMFYMDVRYAGQDSDVPNLELVNYTNTPAETTDNKAIFGKLCTLLQWHIDDPVSEFEIKRNNMIYKYQGNRNPFIDHEDWAFDLYSDACGITPPINISINPVNKVTEGDTVKLTTSTNGKKPTYLWEQTEGQVITVADLTLSEINLTAPDIADGMKEKFTFKVTMTGDNGVATTTTSFYAYDSNYVAPLQVEIPAVPDTTTGEVITLTANSIINGNGKNIRYTWLQTDGPSVTLVNPKLQTVKFTAPPVSKKSKIKFKVTAEDDKGNVTVETTSISIKPLNKPSSDDGSGGSFGIFGTLSLLGLGLLRRKAK